jgi:hypothetical protein
MATSDRSTKMLLLAIALGLWANAAVNWGRATTLHAQSAYPGSMDSQRLDAIVKNTDATASTLRAMSTDTASMNASLRALVANSTVRPTR